jgi:hypothetical protein
MKAVRNFKALLEKNQPSNYFPHLSLQQSPEMTSDELVHSPTALSSSELSSAHSPFAMLDAKKLDKESFRAYKNSIMHAIRSSSIASNVTTKNLTGGIEARDEEEVEEHDVKRLAKTLPKEIQGFLRSTQHAISSHKGHFRKSSDWLSSGHHEHLTPEPTADHVLKSTPSTEWRENAEGNYEAIHGARSPSPPPVFLNVGSGDTQHEDPELALRPPKLQTANLDRTDSDTMISAPPQGTDDEIFQSAYDDEVARIRREKGDDVQIFKTRRNKDDDSNIHTINAMNGPAWGSNSAASGFKKGAQSKLAGIVAQQINGDRGGRLPGDAQAHALGIHTDQETGKNQDEKNEAQVGTKEKAHTAFEKLKGAFGGAVEQVKGQKAKIGALVDESKAKS